MKHLRTRFFVVILSIGMLQACHTFESTNMIQKQISQNWIYKQVNGKIEGNANVPGTIHTDLLSNQHIEDPFYRMNEKSQQWIDKEDWEYSTTLVLSKKEQSKDNLVLSFDGLDTYAEVYLNDTLILETDNMFRQWEVSIKPLARVGENHLRIFFHSPIKKGLALLESSPYAYPANNDQSENGELGDKKVSVFTRKAGYHYGWDWGPRFVTSGIWRPITLKAWNDIRIKHVFIKQPSVNAELAKLEAQVQIETNAPFKGRINVVNKNTGEKLVSEHVQLIEGKVSVSLPFDIAAPKLWWSAGMGQPNLYQFEIQVVDNNEIIAKESITTGLRSLKLVREKDKFGESFLFELNGVPVFMKGANYIPNDNFLPQVTHDEYQKVIADAVDANMNMLRVWGGGIYEDDYFYDLCDKNGIMVWQDFMFACSMYPGNEAFLENIRQEAIDNVVRLRNHPSIALWCGNNEINTAWSYFTDKGWGWKQQYTQAQKDELQQAYVNIFHKILPSVVKDYTDGDDYWPSSPQAGYEPEKIAGDKNTSGDMHYWGVWHGLHPLENFEVYKARFMSEYGFQSFPDFETVKKYTLPEDYNIESDVMAAHQRSGIGNLRIKEYMSWDYIVPTGFEHILYMSQVLQARSTKMAIEAHRRAMPYCMGTLYWQINDCWPVASWSSTDYTHKWKAMHYITKKAYEPIIVSAFEDKDTLKIYAVSDNLKDKKAMLRLTVQDFNGTKISEEKYDVLISGNSSSLVKKRELYQLIGGHDKTKIILSLELTERDKTIAKNLHYFSKPKDQKLPDPKINTMLIQKDGKSVLKISTDKIARSIYLNVPDQPVSFSDNYFDLLPNEEKYIETIGTKELVLSELVITHLQQIK